MSDIVLVINAGSSSLKFSLFETDARGEPDLLAGGQVEGIGVNPRFSAKNAAGEVLADIHYEPGSGHRGAMQRLSDWLAGYLGGRKVGIVGHRVVHGGTSYAQPVMVDGNVMEELEKLIPLAPLHQPHNLKAIEAVALSYPGVKQVACFDTAFHQTHPWVADTFALPRRFYDQGIRRYGFHGLSYEFIAGELARVAPHLALGKVVVCHLGNGASACAIHAGKSVDSTMGFTALDGLPMGTRAGQIDPGVLLHLIDELGMSTAEVTGLLYKESGLKGLSGISSDMRDLGASEAPEAAQAIAYFTHRIRREVGALAASMGGIDGLVFTAGIGEHAAPVREQVVRGLGWLGITFDAEANRTHGPMISAEASPVEAWVIPTNEELMIARHAISVVAGASFS